MTGSHGFEWGGAERGRAGAGAGIRELQPKAYRVFPEDLHPLLALHLARGVEVVLPLQRAVPPVQLDAVGSAARRVGLVAVLVAPHEAAACTLQSRPARVRGAPTQAAGSMCGCGSGDGQGHYCSSEMVLDVPVIDALLNARRTACEDCQSIL